MKWLLTLMSRILRTLEWKFDYYVAPFLYNGNQTHRYVEYMCNKYPKRFQDCIDRQWNKSMK
mgnify:CR=1 FL=1